MSQMSPSETRKASQVHPSTVHPSVLAVAETETPGVLQPDSCRPDRQGVPNAQLDPARKQLSLSPHNMLASDGSDRSNG